MHQNRYGLFHGYWSQLTLPQAACVMATLLVGGVGLLRAQQAVDPQISLDPEEITEAFETGFIDYDQYQTLLEISSQAALTAADSAYLCRIPDILAGLSANPLLQPEPDSSRPAAPKRPGGLSGRGDGVLYRRYQPLSPERPESQMYRLQKSSGGMRFYGEIYQGYSGATRWSRRFLEYIVTNGGRERCRLTVGNYGERFGLGLTYGHHGRLLSATDSSGNLERFLFPRYSGSNGVCLTINHDSAAGKIAYDVDRTESHQKEWFGLSLPISVSFVPVQLSAGYGILKNRRTAAAARALLLSASSAERSRWLMVDGEFAGAMNNHVLSMAGAGELRWKRRSASVHMTAWHYGGSFPSWFSGGPSARRYRTTRLNEIDLSFADRFGGETGGAIKTACEIAGRWRWQTMVGHAWRGPTDHATEVGASLGHRVSPRYQIKFGCYWRNEALYLCDQSDRRWQLDVVRDALAIKTRIALGHNYDASGDRGGYLAYIDNVWKGSGGRLHVTGKIDQIDRRDLKNHYLYIAAAHESDLSRRIGSAVKYTYRYHRGQAGSGYSQLRWDLIWRLD